MLVTLDFETFWADDYTLKKMTATEYLYDPRFEIISCAIKLDDAPTEVVFGHSDVKAALEAIDWTQADALGHNMSQFDSYILAWVFGITPRTWLCTLALAAPFHARTTGVGLGALVEFYELGVKNQEVLHETKGRHLDEFTPDELQRMAEYNKADTDQCYALFHVLKDYVSEQELKLLDVTIRLATEPQFIGDTKLFAAALKEERARKSVLYEELREILGLESQEKTVKFLRSRNGLPSLLEAAGVEVPMKISTTTGKPIPAFAKTDEGMQELLENPDPVVSLAAQCRLKAKSTILESRLTRLIDLTEATGGPLPITLKYCGAATTGRWSGYNWNPQNLARVNPDRPDPSDALRKGLRAPPGYTVIVADSSGIELRVNHFLWQEPETMNAFRADPAKADPYKAFASTLYDKPQADVTKAERQVGKVSHLGLGYGAGHVTFRRVARVMGNVRLEPDEARSIVYLWRGTYWRVANGWNVCGYALGAIHDGQETAIDPWGLCTTARGGIRLPSGRMIYYPALHLEETGDWWYGTKRFRTKLYGAKVDENIVQALARDTLADYITEFYRRTQCVPAHFVHDELIYVVPTREAQALHTELLDVMRQPPSWWPELVVWAEGGMGQCYGDAK